MDQLATRSPELLDAVREAPRELGKQNCEPLLSEVMIVAQNFRDTSGPQGNHRSTVGQTVLLVGPRLIKSQGLVKCSARLWQYVDLRIAADLMDQRRRLFPPIDAITAKVSQDFAEHIIGR